MLVRESPFSGPLLKSNSPSEYRATFNLCHFEECAMLMDCLYQRDQCPTNSSEKSTPLFLGVNSRGMRRREQKGFVYVWKGSIASGRRCRVLVRSRARAACEPPHLSVLTRPDGITEIRFEGGSVFRETNATVSDQLVIEAFEATLIAIWNETDANGCTDAFYALPSSDGKLEAYRTSYKIGLGTETRDPLFEDADVPPGFEAGPAHRLFIVQFHTHALPVYREALVGSETAILDSVNANAYLVEASSVEVDQFALLPYDLPTCDPELFQLLEPLGMRLG